MAKKITTTFKAQNIGPHINLSNSLVFSSLKVGVFANNGSGKTFLSRMFRLVENPEIENANKILSINSKSGYFCFQIDEKKDDGNTSEKLEITIEKDKEPIIKNDTKYIYHVFNSDYVKANIAEKKYQPDGEIEGYILGKSKIDLSKEKEKLKELENQILDKGNVFKKAVEDKREDLDNLKVRKNTQEYKFTYTDVYKNTFDYNDNDTFSNLKKLNSVLSKMPDDLIDVSTFETKLDIIFLNDLTKLLSSKFSKSSFAKEFKDKIDSKQDFVAEGLSKLPEDRTKWESCPFCEQELKETAKKLIDDYVKFLNDEESKVKTEINDLIEKLEQLEKSLTVDFANHSKTLKQFNNVKQYIPSYININLTDFDDDKEIKSSINSFKDLLLVKKADIEKPIEIKEFQNEIDTIKKYYTSCCKIINNNNQQILLLNEKRKNTSTEKLNLNRRLCKALYQELQIDLKVSINEIKELHKLKKKIIEDITEKESQEKVSKKAKVLESLKYYLNCFFGDKYTLDEESFCLKFKTHLMTENATDILSDGEKSIVAFCFYLSDIHKVVSKETDYENLFLIIDDPISSLDFHYVYSVSQVLRNLKEQLKVERNRFLIFTHNLEFMSILIRNNIVGKGDHVILINGELKALNRELVMPYEEHLRDVYSVSKSTIEPSHTTPNSVRHVLETIQRFEAPNMILKDYVDKQGALGENEFIYSLMHDASHGVIRQQKAYTNEMITKGCEVVIEFINGKYEGQIKQIES